MSSRRYRRYALGLLLTIGVLAWIDRQILAILLEAIKRELSLSDTQLGLLGGIAFGLFSGVAGIPLAWLLDRVNRRNVLSACVAIWSVVTALSGAASGFAALFAARAMVGIGEAGVSPAAHSLVSDYFPPRERAAAHSVYLSYIPLGGLFGLLLGGWVNQLWGWRAAFFVVGAPGLAVALLARLTLREPARGQSDAVAVAELPLPLVASLRYLWRRRSLRHLQIGGALYGIGAFAAAGWLPAMFVRVHGMKTGEIGTALGLIGGLCGLAGTLTGGAACDRAFRATGDARWYMWISSIGIAIASGAWALVTLWPSATGALAVYAVPSFLGHMFLGPAVAMMQGMAGVRRRALIVGVYLMLTNLVAMGLGPLLVGAISDWLELRHGPGALPRALLWVVVPATLWSSLHFLLASRHLRDDLAAGAES